jgi:flagellar protein FliS
MPRDPYLESRVLAADPVELIHMLYEHALAQLRSARAALAAGDIVGRSRAVTKALEVLGELEGSLDYNAGGSISRNLAKLYQYMRRRLVDGAIKRQDADLAEVESLLQTLGEGWTAMRHAAAVETVAHSWNA